ncbi:mucolipin-3 [Galendromus occidentalis]|uniref:Mucolipin-3 n=1 Tax=Galendromus occidentalis TaxID=34638 RepID=A0AAJ6QXZ1_9ACAR|nr:mucolipin-3 [Galendromus occidentalis]
MKTDGVPSVVEEPDPRTSIQDESIEQTEEERRSFLSLEQRMRRRLRFFFMNPIEKFQAKGRLPWKLGLQISKIIVVTLQLVFFGYDSYAFQQQHRDTNIALDHMFLEGWTSIREVAAYPPSSGPYAVYTKTDFYTHVNSVIKRYSNVTQTAIASLGYDTIDGSLGNVTFYKTQYRNGQVFPHNETLSFDNTEEVTPLPIDPKLYPMNDPRWQSFSIQDYMRQHNFSLSFDKLIRASIHFNLKTVYLKSLSTFDLPECYKYSVRIIYNNEAHDGQLLITLTTASTKLECKTNVHYAETGQLEFLLRQLMNVVVILICCGSLVLCARSLMRGQLLRKKTEAFFWTKNQTTLTWEEKLDFVDFWYVMIMMNDILIIIGSLIKMQLEQRIIDGAQYNFCSTLLGLGNLLVWAGVLRYLGFFRKYNILILTMRRATPNILRFLLCAVLLYMGFCFCGWVVLGPHNIKFRSLSSTSECLFALMNGDDMFATFAIMGESTGIIWWFARIYLYMFLILFIYCVISLFLSVIMDSYETIRESHENDARPSDLWKFIQEIDGDGFPGADLVRAQGRPEGMNESQTAHCLSWNALWRRLRSQQSRDGQTPYREIS